MALKIVTKPDGYPVDVDDAKAHLRVDHDDDDLQIEAMIAAATDMVDGPKGFLGRALLEQTWDLYLDAFPVSSGRHRTSDGIEIPLPPLIDVDGVFYLDGAGDEREFDEDSYIVDTASEPGRVALVSGAAWPTSSGDVNSVRIRFRCGYIDTADSPPSADVPFAIKAAILLHVADLYENRESMVVGDSVATIPWSAEQLLRRHRVYLGMA